MPSFSIITPTVGRPELARALASAARQLGPYDEHIVVGDGRNNHNDPRLEIFRTLARRSRRLIWINPEPPHLWGTGDSDMLDYAPLSTNVVMATTLAELSAAVDELLSEP